MENVDLAYKVETAMEKFLIEEVAAIADYDNRKLLPAQLKSEMEVIERKLVPVERTLNILEMEYKELRLTESLNKFSDETKVFTKSKDSLEKKISKIRREVFEKRMKYDAAKRFLVDYKDLRHHVKEYKECLILGFNQFKKMDADNLDYHKGILNKTTTRTLMVRIFIHVMQKLIELKGGVTKRFKSVYSY